MKIALALLLCALGCEISDPAVGARPIASEFDSGDLELVAAVKVDDSGQFVRGFGVTSVEKTGDDGNFSVRVTLEGTAPIGELYPEAVLTDARAGFSVDLGQTVGGPVFIDVAVEPDHTSGFYLTVFRGAPPFASDADPGPLELVATSDVTAAPVEFRDLSCLPGTVQGYRLVFRLRVGTAGTTVRLRINADDSIDYRSERLDVAGGVAAGAAAVDDALLLHPGTLGAYWFVDGEIDIPTAAPSVEGVAVFWTASVTESSANDVSEVLASYTTGAAKWTVHNNVDILQLLATTGPTEQGTFIDGTATLYRWLK